MRTLLLTLLCVALFTQAYAALQFNLVTQNAPWAPRARPGLVLTPVSAQSDVFVPQGAMVLMGGDLPDGHSNDIWMSSNNGRDWKLISGNTNGVQAPGYGSSSFDPSIGESAYAVDPVSGRVYKIGGTGSTNDVWVSDNIVQWTKINSNPTFPGRKSPGATVDSTGRVILAGGFIGSGSLADVWVSNNKGRGWTLAVGYNSSSSYSDLGRAPWAGSRGGAPNYSGGRGVMDFGTWKNPSNNQEFQFIWTGSSTNTITFNDVWVSGDSGSTWNVVCKAAPWVARNDDTGLITANGILIVAGGRGAQQSGGVESPDLNDVWASLDGGHTWGMCSGKAEFPSRRYHTSVFDSNGYYYIMGGVNDNGTYYNDVWVSSFSFNDANAVGANCGLKQPPCGVGLVCFPGSERLDDDGVIRCPATDLCTSLSGGNSNTGAVAALAVLFVIATLIAAYLAYYVYKMKKNAHANHIGSSDSLGSMNDGNSLYKPLTIHS
jgi:hypothetical protein